MTNNGPSKDANRRSALSFDEAQRGIADKADLKAVFRAKGFVLTDEHRASARDWGRFMMVFYGSVTILLWGFAAFAFRHDDTNQKSAMSRWPLHAKAQPIAANDPQMDLERFRNR